MRKRIYLTCLSLCLSTASVPVRAGIGNACEVKQTPDGFVAIRSTPSAKGVMVAKARPGHIVEVVMGKDDKPQASGLWWRVRHFPGAAMPSPGQPGSDRIREGWMNHRLIDGCG